MLIDETINRINTGHTPRWSSLESFDPNKRGGELKKGSEGKGGLQNFVALSCSFILTSIFPKIVNAPVGTSNGTIRLGYVSRGLPKGKQDRRRVTRKTDT
jgi:hypothetical protein